MPGADMSGYAGYTDGINNHYLRIFGSAAIMSLVTGGMAYTMDSMGGDNGGTITIRRYRMKWGPPWPRKWGKPRSNCCRKI